MTDKYVVFILCYKRPDIVYTLNTLMERGYTGDYKLVLGDDDPTINEYKHRYGEENIVIFSKNDYNWVDMQDNFGRKNCVVYARNAVFDIAESLGYRYFVVLDDDYVNFRFRWADNNSLKSHNATDVDTIFDISFNLLNSSPQLKCVGIAQGGDYIGGCSSSMIQGKTIRKIMNTWFCDTQKRFYFTGTINEDTTMYTTLGNRGDLFLTINNVNIEQLPTQQTKGGLVDVYLDLGTYVKSFYSVMSCPSAVKVSVMGDGHLRLHHKVYWNNCAPKLISDIYKK